uniref:Uncharacterized protein n=1 Tax=Nelumbo nucifera TaxID=4432 RepID=A0A822XMM8_NELNU|nr:TPA_asm: hypothetical protein HUJ06_020241 [Nelumbo nucifera]
MEGERVPTAQSSKNKTFPAGLRILTVDDDSTCLKIVEKMLQSLDYQVVAVQNAIEALSILRERKGGFDLVLTDVHLPGMDGIALLEHVLREFKLPVIIMSANDKENIILRSLQAGASYYIGKPVTLNDLRNIWQHVVLKRKEDVVVMEKAGSVQRASSEKVSGEDIECESSVNENNWKRQEAKRKASHSNKDAKVEVDRNVSFSPKKARVIWSPGLHKKFLNAVEKIGLDRAVPKKILELMDTPGLTRENIASHLQKYRIFLKRLKEARQALEPGIARSLTSGALKSSFAVGHPLLDPPRGFPALQDSLQSRTPLIRPELGSSSMSQLGYGQPIPTSNHGNMVQPFLGSAPSLNQRMRPHCVGMSSSLLGRGTGTMQMNPQQSQMQTRYSANTLLNLYRHNHNSINPRFENMGSSTKHNQAPIFNYTNNNHAGFPMTDAGELQVGLGQMICFSGRPSNGISGSYTSMDKARKGKETLTATGKCSPFPELMSSFLPGFAPQSLASSGSRFRGANHFPTTFPGVIQQPSPPPTWLPPFANNVIQQQPPLPSALPQQQEENESGIESELDILLELIKSSSSVENTSLAQAFEFDDGDGHIHRTNYKACPLHSYEK